MIDPLHGRAARHWTEAYDRSPEEPFLIESVIASMDAIGVASAVLHVPDDKYMNEIARRYPDRIAFLTVAAPGPSVEQLVEESRERPEIVGLRILIRTDADEESVRQGAYEPLLASAEAQGVPVFALVSEHLTVVEPIAGAHPGLVLVVDHLGLPQPPTRKRDDPPFRRLQELLNLARYPNVLVKFIGAPSYSNEAYPFHDIWPHLHKVLDAFGPERLMWGSDFTRFWGMFTYSELLTYLLYSTEVSDRDKEWLLGRTIREKVGWPPQ